MRENIVVNLLTNPDSLVKGFKAAVTSVHTFNNALGKVQNFAGGINDAMKKIGQVSAGASIGIAASMGSAAKAASEFETGMRNVNSIAGETEEEFRKTGSALLDISRKVPQNARILADGLYDIASSGLQGAEGLQVLEASAVAATAGMSTTDVAAKATMAAINAYGLAAEDAADINDIMFATVDKGVLTFEELASNMGDWVGMAAAAKVPLDQASAALGTMTLAGVGAAEASTSLARVMQSFIDPQEKMLTAINELGYASGVQMIQTEGFAKSIGMIEDYVGGSVDGLVQMYGEIRAARGALALSANDGQNYARVLNSVATEAGRAGAAQDAYAEQSKALSVRVDLMKSSLEAARIEIGQYYLPVLGAVVDNATFMLDTFGKMPSVMKAGVAVFMALSLGVTALVGALAFATARHWVFRKALISNTLAMRLGINSATTFSGVLLGLGRSLKQTSNFTTAAANSTRRFNVAARAITTPLNIMGTSMQRFATASASMSGRLGIVGAGVNSLSGRIQRLGGRMAAASISANGFGNRLRMMSTRIRTAATGTTMLGNVMRGFKNRVGAMVTFGFLAIDMLQEWGATASAAREEQKAFADEVAASHDTSTLTGMADAYDEMYNRLQELNEESERYNNIGGAVKGGLEVMSPFNDNNVQEAHEKVIALGDELLELEARHERASGAIDAFNSVMGLSVEEVEALARTMGVDLGKETEYTTEQINYMIDAMSGSTQGWEDMAEQTGHAVFILLAAASGMDEADVAASGLASQLQMMRSPIAHLIEDTFELTEAQKALKSASEDVGSFSTGLTDALQAEKDEAQRIADEELEILQKRSEDNVKAEEKGADDRIEARERELQAMEGAMEDEVQAMKSGSAAKKAAQDRLDAFRRESSDELESLREGEQESLEEYREREADILKQKREDLQKTVEEQKLSLTEMTNALIGQNWKLISWQQNLVRVAARVGDDVAKYLGSMGTEGVDIVDAMANGTDEETKRMAEAIRTNMELTGDEAAAGLDAGMQLAAAAAGLGAEATRQAVLDELGLLPADVADIMVRYGQAIESGLNAVITGMGGSPLEFDFAPAKPGDADFIGPIHPRDVRPGDAGFIGPIHPDDVDRVRAKGGIDMPAHIARNPKVLFGEATTGGEAYIPLGQWKRSQSIPVWEEAGRMLGMIPATGSGLIPPSQQTTSIDRSTHKVSKRSDVNFTGPIYASDPKATLRYAERRKRALSLVGRNN